MHVGAYIQNDIYKIIEFCKKRIHLVEDCYAVLIGFKNRYAGNFGITGAFSFATKSITSGEGGMITTNNKKLFEKLNQ